MIAFKELLVRAKRGEEKAFEELFEQFEPLVRKCSYMNGHTDEDLRQILLMEFVQAIRKFKIGGNAIFCGNGKSQRLTNC